MATRKLTRSRNARSARQTPAPTRQLEEALGRFSDAIAVLHTVQRALEHREIAADEEVALRIAIRVLDDIYNELDLTILLRRTRSVMRTARL